MSERKGDRIRRLILEHILDHPSDIVKKIARETGLKKSTVNYHLEKLVKDGKLSSAGKTRNKRYELVPLKKYIFKASTKDIAEHEIYNEEFAPYFENLSEHVEYAWNHGITEMMNNVRDHSEGGEIEVELIEYATHYFVRVSDDGVGIFNKIKNDQNLNTHEDVVLELSKGGVTSDPENHAGEGIFFTSKLIDMFCIYSGGDVYQPSKKKFSKKHLKI